HSSSEPLPPPSGGGTDSRAGNTPGEETVDGIAARIEDDIITESEVRELSAFQELVDGKPKPRSEIIKELADQWIVRGEAALRRILTQQLFLSRFIDYRFRPAAQVDEPQIETFYHDEFAPQLEAKKQP